ncbi:alpha/beta hydrolase [Arsenicicoccus dermatophilus]|uniref:alpha/beta hydrolase n=1 Tax=Arsenicicoccus dermatophilus TaxID=1076331 RepID=UPI001F4CEBEA|nr:alpha/beta hydrolase [Arsenicicoccus dermatophilus]MCH8614260.1 alpha/beta hydrolase [Arsenicicoccus dermatophilus]
MSSSRAATLAALTLALAGSAVAPAASAAPGSPAAARAVAEGDQRTARATQALTTPQISWRHCGQGLQCGTMDVPLDYRDLSKGTITLMLSRRPADDQGKRIGSMFVNPGGPGGQATTSVRGLSQALGPEVRHRFDVVGIGPRGVEGADLAVCTGKPGESMPTADEHAFPLNAKEMQQHLAYDEAFRRTCRQHKPRILDHMTTADTARDMDLARRALGDKKITYYGISYGTYLGATYAAMYPQNVRALVVDGVLDPVAWATGRGKEGTTVPVTERINSHKGASEELNAVLAECERSGVKRCPQAATAKEDWKVLMDRLAKGPIDLKDGTTLSVDDVIALTTQVLYSYDDIPVLLPALEDLREAVAPRASARADTPASDAKQAVARLQALAAKVKREHPSGSSLTRPLLPEKARRSTSPAQVLAAPAPEPSEAPTYDATFHGVLCADSVNPANGKSWIAADPRARKAAGSFGPFWLWRSSVCAGWPGSSAAAYRGPFTKPTSTPVMVIGTQHDPATPYSGAKAYRSILPTSRLVTLKNGFGHGALDVSSCVDKIRTSYLLTGKAPAKDAVCTPDHPLFTSLG